MVEYEGNFAATLTVNRQSHRVVLRPADLLLDVLREQLGLTGAKSGCKNGDCGACTVLVDGKPIKSCLYLAVEAIGREILTVEGLGGDPIQQAFITARAFQCGYCTSGFLMVCHGMMLHYPQMPAEIIVEEWLQANLCRCTSYQEIRAAIAGAYEAKAQAAYGKGE